MTAVAAPVERLRERVTVLPGWLVALLGLTALVALSTLLRTQAMVTSFWIDEGLSVGIADRPLGDIPGTLRLDGAPPLYYMLLSVWMDLRGRGEGDTHALSLGIALLCIPVAWASARALWGTREAWLAAVVAAFLPYLTYYAQETRMYALVALLSLVVSASFALVFVQRRRGFLPLFSGALLAALYTHNWALFLGAAAFLLAVGLAWRSGPQRRPLLRDVLLAFAPVGLLYLPWLPTLLFQAAHTGAPWAERPAIGRILAGVAMMLGRDVATTAAFFGAGAGMAVLAARPRGLGGRSPAARGAIAIGLLGLATLLLAWLASQISPAWANRYFAVAAGPLILLLAAGFARGGRIAVVALVICLVVWQNPRDGELRRKSNAATVGALFSARLLPGDQVVVTHPEQIAVVRYYLPEGLRWADSLGPVRDPRVFDWRDALERLEMSETAIVAEPLIRRLDSGQRLLLVQPLLRGQAWNAPWTRLVRERVVEWERMLDADHRLRRVDTAPKFGLRQPPRGLRGVLYVRR